MSVYDLDLGGQRVATLRVTIPLVGAWTADLELPGDAPIAPGPQTLTVGNLALVGAVVRQDSIAGTRTVRLVGGAGGWGKTLPPQSYQDDAGVVRATVLRDLAALTGEVFFPADLAAAVDVLGTGYVREGGVEASRTLDWLAPGWWVDAQGLTHLVPRLPGTVASPYLVDAYSGASGRLVASTEDPASWVPGATLVSPFLDGTLALVDVAIVAGDDDQLRVEALVQPGGALPASDRVLGLLRAIIRHEVRALTFAGVWEYQVVTSQTTADGRTLVDGVPLAAVAALPQLRAVEVRPGVPGLSCSPTPGSRVLVAFVNHDPARPVVTSFDAAPGLSSTVTAATEASIVAPMTNVGTGGAVPVALAPALIAFAAQLVTALGAATPPITVQPLDPSVAAVQLRAS